METNWSERPLYKFLREILPTYRTVYDRLDVKRLCSELDCSHEAIYKWLRSGRLTAKNAAKIMQLANSKELIALRDGKSIEINDFNQFVYAI